MKKLYILAAMGLAALCANAQSYQVDEVLTYDFAKAGVAPKLDNLNCGWWFKSWENANKQDSQRQDYKGYTSNALSQAVGLPEECHVWIRNPRLTDGLTTEGYACTSSRNFVVDGLKQDYTVTIDYTTVNTDSSAVLLYTNSEGSLTTFVYAEGGEALTPVLSTIESGQAVKVAETSFVNSKGVEGGYLSVMLHKGITIQKVTIADETGTATFVYDLKKAGSPLSLANLNYNSGMSGKIYVYEGEDKADSNRNDFKGYTPDANSAAAGLPEVCNVFQRTDRYSGQVSSVGITTTNDRQWAITGLDDDDVVEIFYDATGASAETPNIKYATGATSGTVAFLSGSADTLRNATDIASGQAIEISKAPGADDKANGYIGLQVYKGMVISKVVITKRTALPSLTVTDAEGAAFEENVIDLGEIYLNKAVETTLVVKATKLADDVAVTAAVDDETGSVSFALAETTVAELADSYTLKVTPKEYGDGEATLTITAGELSQTLTIVWVAKDLTDDLVAINNNYTFVAQDNNANGNETIAAGTFFDGGKILSPSGNNAATNKKNSTVGDLSALNCMRLKGYQNYLVFTVARECVVTVYGNSDSRRFYAVSTSAPTDDTQYLIKGGTGDNTLTFNAEPGIIYYLTGVNEEDNKGGDLWLAAIDFSFATVGIESIEAAEAQQADLYDIQGRKAQAGAKGLFIVGGKKVLVK